MVEVCWLRLLMEDTHVNTLSWSVCPNSKPSISIFFLTYCSHFIKINDE